MRWTSPADLRAELLRMWNRGEILAAMVSGESPFPKKMRLKRPGSRDMAEQFHAVRSWIADLRRMPHVRLQMRHFRHPTLGENEVPQELWVDTMERALALIGKHGEAVKFEELVALVLRRQPLLKPWMQQKPLRALALFSDFPRLLDVVEWMQCHPRPGIWLRQVDLPGIHTKFIEVNRGVLAEWLDLALPAEAVVLSASGVGRFARRYGFRDKPARIRFRMLDPACNLLSGEGMQDMTLDAESFAALDPAASRIFFTENETNYLAFPQVAGGMVVFGAGYGFELLGGVRWLCHRTIYYWGDIDTHGFAILDQLRGYLPHARSMLMDRETLMAHRPLWGIEARPATHDLAHLTDEEAALYDDLRDNRISPCLRLEQEHVGFDRLEQLLARCAL